MYNGYSLGVMFHWCCWCVECFFGEWRPGFLAGNQLSKTRNIGFIHLIPKKWLATGRHGGPYLLHRWQDTTRHQKTDVALGRVLEMLYAITKLSTTTPLGPISNKSNYDRNYIEEQSALPLVLGTWIWMTYNSNSVGITLWLRHRPLIAQDLSLKSFRYNRVPYINTWYWFNKFR